MSLARIAKVPATSNRFKSVLQTLAFFGAYVIFGVVGTLTSLACLLPAALFRDVRANRFGQNLIHRLFAWFVGYVRGCGLVQLDADELSALRYVRGEILVANHPCLLDAVLIVSQVPRVVCLMKGSLARNIVLCGTAQLAGYILNESGPGLFRQCETRLRQGANLLVFPEGTRSVDGRIHPFKLGFALVSARAQSPVQTIIITTESDFLGKGRPFFKRPQLPIRFSLRLGTRFIPGPSNNAKSFGHTIEAYFRSVLSQDSKPVLVSPP